MNSLLVIRLIRLIRLIRHITALFTPVFLCGTLAAQEVKLSADPIQPVLPSRAQVQSAAGIGDITLVVWGSTVANDDGDPVTGLYMQKIRGTTPIDSPMVLTSGAARPFGSLYVRGMGDRFLVCWNDERSDSGIYARVVDINGHLFDEMKLFDGRMSGTGIVPIRLRDRYLLFRSDTSGTDTCSIDSDGNPLNAFHHAYKWNISGLLQPKSMSGYTMLDIGGGVPVILDSNGAAIALSAKAGEKFLISYFIARNGAVATIVRNRISEYKTALDEIPERSFTALVPDSLAPSTETISYNDSGTLVITMNDNGIFTPGYGYVHAWMYVFSLREISPGVFGDDQRVGFEEFNFLPGYSQCRPYFDCREAQLTRLAGNSYRVAAHFKGDLYCDYQTPIPISAMVTYRSPVGLPGNGAMGIVGDIQTRRVVHDSESTVAVKIDSSWITLRARVASGAVNVPQMFPAIANIGGEIRLGWFSLGLDSVVTLGRWNAGATTPVQVLPPLHINIADNSDPAYPAYTLACRNNGFILSAFSRWTDTSKAIRQHYIFWSPTADGWRRTISITDTNQPTPLKQISAERTPDGKYSMIAVAPVNQAGVCLGAQLFVLDTAGSVTRLMRSVPFTAATFQTFLPVSDREYLELDDRGIHHVREDSLISNVSAGRLTDARFIGLEDLRILKYSVDGGRIFATMISSRNNSLHAYQSPVISPLPVDLFVLENPSDSGIAMVYGGTDGIRVTMLDKFLNPLRENIQVSREGDSAVHPVAAFRGDSIYIAWEDYRNGASDIYGTILPAVTANASVDTNEGFSAGKSYMMITVPNPASSMVIISVRSTARQSISISIVDMRGEIRAGKVLQQGERTARFDISMLPNGVYIAAAESEYGKLARMIRIVH
ncbi:MAG: T9SS type A sorting domain-containing protein [Bacteroidota bacterium]